MIESQCVSFVSAEASLWALSLLRVCGMPLSPMKSLCTDGNSDSVVMPCTSMILELQPQNAFEHQCPSIDLVFAKCGCLLL